MKPSLICAAASILVWSTAVCLAQEQIRIKCNAGYSYVFGVCVNDQSGDIIGPYLADDNGMTLYVFDKDAPEKSACTGDCASSWLPLGASASDTKFGEFDVIRRDDGSKQWAMKGRPLYTRKNDKFPGDMAGDGLSSGAWHVAKP